MNKPNSFFEKFIPTDLLPPMPDSANKAEMEAYQKQKEFFHTLIADQYLKLVIRPIIVQYLSMKTEDHANAELGCSWVLPSSIIEKYLSLLNDDDLILQYTTSESRYMNVCKEAGLF